MAFDWALEYPGILLPIFRQVHTHITGTTRKTFIEQTLPPELRGRPDLVRIKKSQGEDVVEFLFNGSQIHFVGLDNPGKVFSAEFGAAMFDEAQEISEDDVVTVNTRVRQRCLDCVAKGWNDCPHMPHKLALAFNPSDPGHWLFEWFIIGADTTEWGSRKPRLVVTDGTEPIGDAEFFRAYATDNPFLPPDYVTKNLGGMSEAKKRRYLLGLWEFIGGDGFFDQDALANMQESVMNTQPVLIGEPEGDPEDPDGKTPSLVPRKNGRLYVFKPPVRTHVEPNGDEVKAHRYVVAVDASSGASADFSGIQVIDVDSFEQVAEWQGKADPDRLGVLAFLIAAVYNGALLVPEITGGWGFAVVKRIQRLAHSYKGPAATKPRLYTRPATDRLSDRFTTLLGWDTNVKSRANMLSICEEAIRDGSLTVYGQRTIAEMSAFVIPERGRGTNEYQSPRARHGRHDDLVIALAIGVTVAARLPKQNRSLPRQDYEPAISSVTGY